MINFGGKFIEVTRAATKVTEKPSERIVVNTDEIKSFSSCKKSDSYVGQTDIELKDGETMLVEEDYNKLKSTLDVRG